MVNTELFHLFPCCKVDYNILNIVVNTELIIDEFQRLSYYNILNIVVNTELFNDSDNLLNYYNILNIVVNTEQRRAYT